MIPAWLSLLDAIVALVLLAVGIFGAHFNLVLPMAGFSMFLLSFLMALLALLIGLIGLWRTAAPERRAGRPRAVAGIILSLLVAVPVGAVMWRWMSMPYPEINDITTDYDNPPEFVQPPGMSPARMKYDRAKFQPVQSRDYPALAPLKLDEQPDDAFTKVASAAKARPEWIIIVADPKTRTIEGVEVSYLFRFIDDFVIQVRPGPEPNSSLIEMRSRSRDGTGDFGMNYNRIRGFLAELRPGGAKDHPEQPATAS